ncbi:Flp pilus assembly protein TadD [Litorivivens lipolytica]|uniref:Flp pilus assembly protein TadD n=1 Tax=Litorivivens lipolytica TaxID=1524264 RepID=A0A7W4W3E5_9GAMM|nr:tetratricopeptide repeat protein [Litorivivens lipolytica]MBB3046733.1 Flp pilus assembly protein TadD [Litorivivens lipolytica]
MRIQLAVVLSAALLSACSSQPKMTKVPVNSGQQCYEEKSREMSVRLDLIRQTVAEGQYYSAIAHLERERFTSDGARFLMAESLRKSGQPHKALEQYEELKSGCLHALGFLGAGKIHAITGNLQKALAELKVARDLLPTDANIRNDYGFALLANGQYPQAQQEFLTAIQLQNEHPIAIKNLVLALILDRDAKAAWAVAEHHKMTPESFQNLMVRAAQFRKASVRNGKNAVANVPVAMPDSGLEQPILIRTGETL